MNHTIKRLATLGAGLTLAAGGLLATTGPATAAPAAPASAAKPATISLFESYACAAEATQAGVKFWGCNGTWYNANPDVRSVNIDVDPVTQSTSDFRTTRIRTATSLDGEPHVLRGYCSYPNGTTSGQKWAVQVGGNHVNTYNFGGLDTCGGSGVNGGLWIVATGYYGGSRGYQSDIHYNDWASSGAGRMSCASCDRIG